MPIHAGDKGAGRLEDRDFYIRGLDARDFGGGEGLFEYGEGEYGDGGCGVGG